MLTQYVKDNLILSRMNLHITYYYYDSYSCGIEHIKDETAGMHVSQIMALQEEEKGPAGVQLGVFMINAKMNIAWLYIIWMMMKRMLGEIV